MNKERTRKHIDRLQLVIDETTKDVEEMEGRAFNGKNVAEYYGYLAAGLTAVAGTVKELLENMEGGNE